MLKISEITTEYLRNPSGLGGRPWFGWILSSDKSQVRQQAYLLEIAEDKYFQNMIYDSGWTVSRESVHVEAEGFEPASCKKYFVRVKVRDGAEESGYGETAYFITGILKGNGETKAKDWPAAFITAETPEDKIRSASTYLQKEIEVSPNVQEAYACVTALGLYHFYINGQKVGADELTPGWTSYEKHLCYQIYEVTDLLKPGSNALGAMVGAGWYKGKMGFLHLRNNYGDRAGFLMQLVIRYKDGREEIVLTDESWKGGPAPVTFSEIYDGERYDARLEISGWNEPGFRKDKSWKPVTAIPFPKSALTAQPGAQVKKMEVLKAQRIFRTPKGEQVIDFGQNLSGWAAFTVRGKAGEEVRLQCFETLDAAGNVYTANLRTAKQEISYICAGMGEERYHPHFTFQGFRYVQVLSWPGELREESVKALVLYSDMEETGEFTCSNPLVNQLHSNIKWSMKGNFLDVPTDCPQRDERMGWTGDAQIFCRTSSYLRNTYTFFRKWLKDLAADQTEEGGVPHVVPYIISGKESGDWLLSQGTHSAAAWADAAVINPWTLYLMYGDKVILEEQYESMKRWIEFMRKHARDHIWNYKLQFGDWVALDAEEGSYFGATPNDLTCTAYYAYSTGLFAKIAAALGRGGDAEEYQGLYREIVKKFQNTFFGADGKLTAMTQTAHIVALYFDLAPEEYREQTAKELVKLLKKENGHLVTGFVGTPYFCHALSQNGYIEEAYDLLLKEDFPSWLYQVKMGATTIWEHWDGLKPDATMWSPDMNSFNHYAYGAVGEWLYRVVLGMEPDEACPGWRRILITPRTGNAFDYAGGSYKSPYGLVKVHWEKTGTGRGRRLSVTIPPNAEGEIRLEKGAVLCDGGGLDFQRKDGQMTAETGSGVFRILYEKGTGKTGGKSW